MAEMSEKFPEGGRRDLLVGSGVTVLLALLPMIQLEAAPRVDPEILVVEPRRSPWTRPSGVSHYTQRRIAGWRVTTWTDEAGDRIVRLQRWRSGDTLIYGRTYLPGGLEVHDRAEVVVGNCAQGDPVWERGGPEPSLHHVRAALAEHLDWCGAAPETANRMLQGFELAFPLLVTRSRAAAADAAAAADRPTQGRPN
jgi:hypothetical protein